MLRQAAIAAAALLLLASCGPKNTASAGKAHPSPTASVAPSPVWFGVGQPQLVTLPDGTAWSSLEVGKKGWSKAWLFSSADSGQSWRSISVPGLESVGYFRLFDRSHAVLIDEAGSALYFSDDAGAHWSKSMLPIPADGVSPASFIDTHDGWVLLTGDSGSTSLYHTGDGGKSWTKVTIPPSFVYPGSVFFRDSLNGWLGHAASAPELFTTRDGGKNWTPIDLALPPGYPGEVSFVGPVQVADQNLVVMVNVIEGGMGSGFPTSTYLYSSIDYGTHWNNGIRLTSAATLTTGIPAIAIESASHWAAAIGTTFRTTSDSGQTWASYDLEPGAGFVNAGLVFANANVGYLLLGRSADYGACLHHCFELRLTNDGGATWRPASFPELPAGITPP